MCTCMYMCHMYFKIVVGIVFRSISRIYEVTNIAETAVYINTLSGEYETRFLIL